MKNLLAALVLLPATVISPLLGQGDDEDTRKTLVGLNGVYVWVGSIQDEAQRDGLDTMQIRTDVELKLRQAGIPVLIEEQSMSRVDAPVLFVVLNAVKNPEVPLYAFSANVELHQVVRLIRNPAATIRAATWTATGFTGMVGRDHPPRLLRDEIRDLIDRFINAYLAANPKR